MDLLDLSEQLSVNAPAGMRAVTEAEFFDLLRRDPRDIMPCQNDPEVTTWECQRTRAVVGRSLPGWRNPGAPRAYFWTAEPTR